MFPSLLGCLGGNALTCDPTWIKIGVLVFIILVVGALFISLK